MAFVFGSATGFASGVVLVSRSGGVFVFVPVADLLSLGLATGAGSSRLSAGFEPSFDPDDLPLFVSV